MLQENKEIISRFIDMCNDDLDIKRPCNVTFVDAPEDDMTTGCFNKMTRDIRVLSGKRALVDILRSLAHELVHAKQHEEDRLDDYSGADGSPIENEANALAGVIMRKFQKHNRDIYDQ
tara:strand:+ start:22090 stop:22443 length:354 start_codon:yes stop_codon:yes gene_type:complete